MSFFSLIIRPLPISTLFPYTTLFRSNGDPAAQHPPEASIFMQYAMLAFEMRSQAFLMGGNLLFDAFSIRVMYPLKPFFRAVPNLGFLIAQHGLPARREVHNIGRQIPIPKAIIGAASR